MKDMYGFQIDPKVGYARGRILDSSVAETRRMYTGRGLVQKRVKELGRGSVYNMTGLSRSTSLFPGDLDQLKSQVEFHANYNGALEKIIVPFVGGDMEKNTSIVLNRITAAMIAIMQALVERGGSVVSWVPKGRSHPSIENACNLFGIKFHETTELNEFEKMINKHKPTLVAITPLTHAKFHAKLSDTQEAIKIANKHDAVVLVDDAHMPARVAVFQEPPSFKLGSVDLATLSPDKHMWGPRAGVLTGRRDIISKVAAAGFSNGLDAQSGQYVSVINAVNTFNPNEIEEAGDLAQELLKKINKKHPNSNAYLAGPGVGISEYDLFKLVYPESSTKRPYTPIEVSSAVNMEMLRQNGILTIPTVGMPASSPSLRLMMFSDGGKVGVDEIVNIFESAVDKVRDVTNKQEFADLIFKI